MTPRLDFSLELFLSFKTKYGWFYAIDTYLGVWSIFLFLGVWSTFSIGGELVI